MRTDEQQRLSMKTVLLNSTFIGNIAAKRLDFDSRSDVDDLRIRDCLYGQVRYEGCWSLTALNRGRRSCSGQHCHMICFYPFCIITARCSVNPRWRGSDHWHICHWATWAMPPPIHIYTHTHFLRPFFEILCANVQENH